MFLPVVISISIILFFSLFFEEMKQIPSTVALWLIRISNFSLTLLLLLLLLLIHEVAPGSSSEQQRRLCRQRLKIIPNHFKFITLFLFVVVDLINENLWMTIFFLLSDDALWCPYGWFWTFWFFTINK